MAVKDANSKRNIDQVGAEEPSVPGEESNPTTPAKEPKTTRASTRTPKNVNAGEETTELATSVGSGTTPLVAKVQDLLVSVDKLATGGTKNAFADMEASEDETGDVAVPNIASGSLGMRKVVSDSGDEGEDVTLEAKASEAVQEITDEEAAGWGFSQVTTLKARVYADIEDNNYLAVRRLPTNLKYGISGAQKDRLLISNEVLTIVLVGRIADTYFQTDKAIASVHVVPLLKTDLAKANAACGSYSTPPQAPATYNTVRVSSPQPKKKGTGRWEIFRAVYDVTGQKEILPKDKLKLYDALDLNTGDLVALELNMKRFMNSNKVQQASYELKAIMLLRKAKAQDVVIVDGALAATTEKDTLSSAFYAKFSSPNKGKGKGKA